MGVAKLLMLCCFGLCALGALTAYPYFSFRSDTATAATPSHYFSTLRSLAAPWPATELEAKLTPPLLFLLLNLLVATLFVTNTGFLRRSVKNQSKQSDGDFHPQAAIDGSRRKKVASQPTSLPESSARGPLLEAPVKQLINRSSSVKPAMAATSSAAELALLAPAHDAPAQMKPPLDPSARKQKKKRRRASSALEEANSMNQISSNESLRKSPSVPQRRKNTDGDGDDAEDEVDRRAEEFISKFYMQMRMQRLASLERYHQRLDRSYGR